MMNPFVTVIHSYPQYPAITIYKVINCNQLETLCMETHTIWQHKGKDGCKRTSNTPVKHTRYTFKGENNLIQTKPFQLDFFLQITTKLGTTRSTAQA